MDLSKIDERLYLKNINFYVSISTLNVAGMLFIFSINFYLKAIRLNFQIYLLLLKYLFKGGAIYFFNSMLRSFKIYAKEN